MNNFIKNRLRILLKENTESSAESIINVISQNPKKLKLNKPYKLYDNGLDTAINNSEIASFYKRYIRENFKKYPASIPFPFDKLGANKERFNKLNEIAHIFEKYSDVNLNLVKYMCFHLMGIILYDMYFNIKSRQYDVYEKVDELTVPDKTNDLECKKFGMWFTNKENPLNYIIFFSNTNQIINRIRNTQ